MSLPDLTDVLGSWLQVVAYSPVLSAFDNSEVEILNDIPNYKGIPAFIGTVMGIYLVAIGVLKKMYILMYATDQSRRKRSKHTLSTLQDPDFYFRAANLLDRNKCLPNFFCSLEYQSKIFNNLTAEETSILSPFREDLETVDRDNVRFPLMYAVYVGSTAKGPSVCPQAFPECPFQPQQFSRALTWIYQFAKIAADVIHSMTSTS